MTDKDLTICIIEDNISNRKLFSTLLKRADFQIIEFGDGKTSIEWLKSNTPYAILIDILLPDINGTEIVKYIRTQPQGNKLPVIAVTGFGQTSDFERFISNGFDGVIPKPVSTITFVDEVKQIINLKYQGA